MVRVIPCECSSNDERDFFDLGSGCIFERTGEVSGSGSTGLVASLFQVIQPAAIDRAVAIPAGRQAADWPVPKTLGLLFLSCSAFWMLAFVVAATLF
jgi:hypothetical protein